MVTVRAAWTAQCPPPRPLTLPHLARASLRVMGSGIRAWTSRGRSCSCDVGWQGPWTHRKDWGGRSLGGGRQGQSGDRDWWEGGKRQIRPPPRLPPPHALGHRGCPCLAHPRNRSAPRPCPLAGPGCLPTPGHPKSTLESRAPCLPVVAPGAVHSPPLQLPPPSCTHWTVYWRLLGEEPDRASCSWGPRSLVGDDPHLTGS